MKKTLLLIFIISLLLSCSDNKDEYLAYAKFNEYNLKPSHETNEYLSSYTDCILYKKENDKVTVFLITDKRKIVYELKEGFWYSKRNSDKVRGTNISNSTETFILNDTIYALDTFFSDSGKIEWQALSVKTINKDWTLDTKPFIVSSNIVNKFKTIKSFSQKNQVFAIYLKERNGDTLFTYQTNNDKVNPIKNCIWSVDVLDNLGEFGKKFYAAENITSWFVEKKPYWDNCK